MLACNRRARALIGFAGEDPLPAFGDCFGVEWRQLGRLFNQATRHGAVSLPGPRQRGFFARFQLRGRGGGRNLVISPGRRKPRSPLSSA